MVFALKVGLSRTRHGRGKVGILVPSATELMQVIKGLVAAVGRGGPDARVPAVAVGTARTG